MEPVNTKTPQRRLFRMSLPNQLSLLRILLTPVFVFLLFMDRFAFQVSSLVVFTIASLSDWWDGYMARKFGEITIIGQFLDPLADKILVSSGLICFSVLGYIPAWMVFIIVIRDFLMTGLRSYAILKGNPVKTSRIAKWKTFFQIAVIYLAFLIHVFSGKFAQPVFLWIETTHLLFIIMSLVTTLTILTLIIYLRNNRDQTLAIFKEIAGFFTPIS